MIGKRLLLFCFAIFLSGAALSQKVKYKDLMALLNAKQYEQAKPFLKKYLAEVEDNPSAYLFMGIVYQEEILKMDVLKQSDALAVKVDSAVFFYNKCLPKLTEKEIKKNEDYYLMYTRRDLRTGEFGVKLSDIQLDIETRTKSLYERRDRVIALKKYYQEMEVQYNRANSYYKSLQTRFATNNEMLLRSDDELILELERLSAVFDSSQVSVKQYKTTLQALGKTGYNPNFTLREINDMKKQGETPADFMAEEIQLWNYGDWASKTSEIIRQEVYPARKEIIAFDATINKLREKIKKDSSTVNTDELKANPVFTDLKKWDNDPMPSGLFHMKIAELEYMSNVMADVVVKDKSNISNRISSLKHQRVMLMHLDSLATAMVSRDWDKDVINYKNFITSAYGTVAVVKNLCKATQDYARRETANRNKELETNLSLLKWVIYERDSIPLFKDVPEESAYKPLIITETYTAGLKQDSLSLQGYFYTVTPSRTADLKVNFPVDSASITPRDLPLIKSLSLSVSDQSFYVLYYSESRIDGKVPVTIAKVSRSAGLEWTSVIQTELTPVEMKYTASSSELSIKTSGSDGNSKMVVIGKAGSRVQ